MVRTLARRSLHVGFARNPWSGVHVMDAEEPGAGLISLRTLRAFTDRGGLVYTEGVGYLRGIRSGDPLRRSTRDDARPSLAGLFTE